MASRSVLPIKGYAGVRSCWDWESWSGRSTIQGSCRSSASKGHSFCFAQPHFSEIANKAIGQQLSFTSFNRRIFGKYLGLVSKSIEQKGSYGIASPSRVSGGLCTSSDDVVPGGVHHRYEDCQETRNTGVSHLSQLLGGQEGFPNGNMQTILTRTVPTIYLRDSS